MGIVHNGCGTVLELHGLESTTHWVQLAQRHQHILGRKAQLHSGRVYGREVVGIESTHKLHIGFSAIYSHQHAVHAVLDYLTGVVGHGLERVADLACFGVLQHLQAVAVVLIGQGKGLGFQSVKESLLGLNVVGKGLVEVQMVVRYVREYASVEVQSGNAALHNAVRAHLHKAILAARVHHLAHGALQRYGVGCGLHGLGALVAHVVGHGGEETALVTHGLHKLV